MGLLVFGWGQNLLEENQKMFNETKAPDESNNTTLLSSLKYWYIPSEKPQKFITTELIYSYTNCSEFQPYQNRHPKLGSIDSQWVIELGGTDQVYENVEFVRDDLLRLIYGSGIIKIIVPIQST